MPKYTLASPEFFHLAQKITANKPGMFRYPMQ